MVKSELFLLVKSMDKNEKGYFRKFSRLHSTQAGSDYMKLFDCLANMKEYDEEAIKRRFNGQKILSHLRVTKNYLKNLIIRSLRNYHEDKIPVLKRLLSMADAQIMLRKNLTETLLHRMQQEEADSLAAERFVDYLHWAGLHYNWLSVYGYNKKFEGGSARLLKVRIEQALKYVNFTEYLVLANEAEQLHVRAGTEQPEWAMEKMQALLQHPLLASQQGATSVRSKTTFVQVIAPLYTRTGKKDKIAPLVRNTIKNIGSTPQGIKVNPTGYMLLLHRMLNMLRQADVEEMNELTVKFAETLHTCKNEVLSTTWMNMEAALIQHKMRYHLYKRQGQQVLQLGAQLSQIIKRDHQLLGQHELLGLVMEAYALLELKQFEKALEKINTVLNENYKVRSDILIDAEWVNIIIHIELKNYGLAKIFVARTLKQLKKTKLKISFEKKLGKCFMEIVACMETGNKKKVPQVAAEFLNYFEQQAPDAKDYIKHWLETKLKTR